MSDVSMDQLKALAAEVKKHIGIDVKCVAVKRTVIIEKLLEACNKADLSEFSEGTKETIKALAALEPGEAAPKAPAKEPKGEKKVDKDTLEAACKEINKLMKLKPAIEAEKLTAEEMTEEIKALAGEFKPGDEVSAVLKGVLAKLNIGPWLDKEPAGKGSKKSTEPKGEKKERAPRKNGGVTKKSIIIDMLSQKGGATIDEIADKIQKAKLDDKDLGNDKRIVKLYIPKIGFSTKKDEKSGKVSKV